MLIFYLQLATIGLLWVTIHCAGMCGPIVAGLNAGTLGGRDGSDNSSERRNTAQLKRGALNVLAYQLGRAVTYAAMGAMAGLIGASLEAVILGIGRIAALAAGGGLILAAVGTLPSIRRRITGKTTASLFAETTPTLGDAARRITDLVPASGRARIALFGGVMGLLPCMLMFWVLGLAAASADPLTGMALMVGLVVLTTPVLILAGSTPIIASGSLKRWSGTIRSGAMLLSGLWLLLIGAAHNGWIAHRSLDFHLLGRSFTLMFW